MCGRHINTRSAQDLNALYSIVLELWATHEATVPVAMGHLVHALFLDLVRRFDAALSKRLHDEPGYRPYTVSPLLGVARQGEEIALRPGQRCYLRVTLLDGGNLWQSLNSYVLGRWTITVHLGSSDLQLVRLFSASNVDPSGWASTTDWQSLAAIRAARSITCLFLSPTAYHLGDREFLLFPEALPLWESLLRVWNRYAPTNYQMEKQAVRECVAKSTAVADCNVSTETLHYPKYTQKGFVGTCTYSIEAKGKDAQSLAVLAAFAPYSGVGYKTTMAMGQIRTRLSETQVGHT